jgi:hypothetical protein
VSEFLLVEVDAALAVDVEAFIATIGGVAAVCVHGDGWWCQNCPWVGNHG